MQLALFAAGQTHFQQGRQGGTAQSSQMQQSQQMQQQYSQSDISRSLGLDNSDYEVIVRKRTKADTLSGKAELHEAEVQRKFIFLRFTYSLLNNDSLWTDPFWYTAVILEIGFIGFFVAGFVSLLQADSEIAKGWVLLICYIVQTGILFIHSIIYTCYNRCHHSWSDLAPHHKSRILQAFLVMWGSMAINLGWLCAFVTKFSPGCCNEDIPGLTIGAFAPDPWGFWYLPLVVFVFLQLSCIRENYIATYSIYAPEMCYNEDDLKAVENPQRLLYVADNYQH